MVEITSIMSFVGGLKTASDITRSLIDMNVAGKVQGKIIELQSVILAAQSDALFAQQDQFALLERVRSLEKEIADLKSMGAEREKYELKQVSTGAFAYVPKPNTDVSEPDHWLCVKCFDNGQKSILQKAGLSPDKNSAIYTCPSCGTKMATHFRSSPNK